MIGTLSECEKPQEGNKQGAIVESVLGRRLGRRAPRRWLGWTNLDQDPTQPDSGVRAGVRGGQAPSPQLPSLYNSALQNWSRDCLWKQNLQADRSWPLPACILSVGVPWRSSL